MPGMIVVRLISRTCRSEPRIGKRLHQRFQPPPVRRATAAVAKPGRDRELQRRHRPE